MWYLAIFMTPHLKQQERNNGVWGLGWGVINIFLIYLVWGGVENFFPKGWGGGRKFFCPPHENVTPHLVINYSSLKGGGMHNVHIDYGPVWEMITRTMCNLYGVFSHPS